MELVGIDCLEVKDLFVDFTTDTGVFHAVKGVSLTVERGKISVIVGESGSGKSVTSLAIMDLLSKNGRITGGEILVDGTELRKRSRKERQKLLGTKLGMIFQDPVGALDPLFTIENQMGEGLRKHLGLTRQQARERSAEVLRSLNLQDPEYLLTKYPFELSGGMCQRVMIAIAMSLTPSYLIADEPTTALDVTVQKQILQEIYTLSRDNGVGILFITHDLGVVAEIADMIYVMKDGEIVERGTPEQVFFEPKDQYTKRLLDAVL